MSRQYDVNINPFNHCTQIGQIIGTPQFLPKRNNYYQVFKVTILVPRNYLNHDPRTGQRERKADEVKASCYVTPKQVSYYRDKFTHGRWVVIRGEIRSVQYYNKNGQKIQAHPYNLEDIEPYHVPHTDKFTLTSFDRQHIVYGARGLSWLLGHPGLVRKFAPKVYGWLMAHDAFVPTRIKNPNSEK